jgi:hypothetical protein
MSKFHITFGDSFLFFSSFCLSVCMRDCVVVGFVFSVPQRRGRHAHTLNIQQWQQQHTHTHTLTRICACVHHVCRV